MTSLLLQSKSFENYTDEFQSFLKSDDVYKIQNVFIDSMGITYLLEYKPTKQVYQIGSQFVRSFDSKVVYSYLVMYHATYKSGASCHGNINITRKGIKIENLDDVREIEKIIQKDQPQFDQLVITNWKLLNTQEL